MAADVAVDVSDRASSKDGLKDGEFTEILEEAAIDGAMTTATLGLSKFAKAGVGMYRAGKAATTAEKVNKCRTFGVNREIDSV